MQCVRPVRPGRSDRKPLGFGSALLFLVAAGCAGAVPEEPTPAAEMREAERIHVGGEYEGSVSIVGQQLQGSLTIVQDGRALDLAINFPEAGIRATGTGRVTRSGFTAELTYMVDCPGEATLEGIQDPDDRVLSGSISARDCDGTNRGTFRFTPEA